MLQAISTQVLVCSNITTNTLLVVNSMVTRLIIMVEKKMISGIRHQKELLIRVVMVLPINENRLKQFSITLK